METKPERHLPILKSMEEAVEFSYTKNDNFYITAFMIQEWLGVLVSMIVAEYAEKKSASRRFQHGVAEQLFHHKFKKVSNREFPHLFLSMVRFAEFDDSQSRVLNRAHWALSLEFPIKNWPSVSGKTTADPIAKAVAWMRRMVKRLCQWVEAINHAQIHLSSHHIPVAFDPDPDKRELAILGVRQRHFPEMNEFEKEWWQWHHGDAASRFKDPTKWSLVGQAMADKSTTHQNYPALDDLLIHLWPLVRRHNWTFLDLLNVVKSVAPAPLGNPCEHEQNLATHCTNVLGLRKGVKGKTSKTGMPVGFEVAQALCVQKDPSGLS